jgi:hypothetical protein
VKLDRQLTENKTALAAILDDLAPGLTLREGFAAIWPNA